MDLRVRRSVPKGTVAGVRRAVAPLDVLRVAGRMARPLPPLVRAKVLATATNTRSVVGFTVAVLLILGAVMGASAIGAAREDATSALAAAGAALSDLEQARQALSAQRWHDARAAAERARDSFAHAHALLGNVPFVVRAGIAVVPPVSSRYRSAVNLTSAGERFSSAAATVAGVAERSLGSASWGAAIPAMLQHLSDLAPALDDVDAGLDALAAVSPSSLPEASRTVVADAVDLVPTARALTAEARATIAAVPALLGTDKTREYLVLFQNAAERRPSGGFIGSLLGVRFDRGTPTVTDAPGRGPYDVDDVLPSIVPPAPILRVTTRWTLHDSNWSPDFPTSARKALSLYEEARGFTVDGVLAFTSTLLPRLLTATGPLTLADGTVLGSDTALEVLQRRVEVGYDRASNQPKAIVGQLFVALDARIRALSSDQFLAVVVVLRDAARSRDVQVYSKAPDLANRVAAAGWDGSVVPGRFDTLGVNGANLGGGKTDRVVDDALSLTVHVDKNGTVTDTATYIRTHRGVALDPLEGLTNRSYLRLLAPLGSRFTAASGFTPPDPTTFFAVAEGARADADAKNASTFDAGPNGTQTRTELGMATLAGWLDLPVHETRAVKATYELPDRVPSAGVLGGHTYRLRLLRQSGATPSVVVRLELPAGSRMVAASHTFAKNAEGQYETNLVLDQDTDLTVLYR